MKTRNTLWGIILFIALFLTTAINISTTKAAISGSSWSEKSDKSESGNLKSSSSGEESSLGEANEAPVKDGYVVVLILAGGYLLLAAAKKKAKY